MPRVCRPRASAVALVSAFFLLCCAWTTARADDSADSATPPAAVPEKPKPADSAEMQVIMVEAKVVRASAEQLAKLGIDPDGAAPDWGRLAASPEVETLAGASVATTSGNDAFLQSIVNAYFPVRWETSEISREAETSSAPEGNAKNSPLGQSAETQKEYPEFGDPTPLGFILHCAPSLVSENNTIQVKVTAEYQALAGISNFARSYFMPDIQAWHPNVCVEVRDGGTTCIQHRKTAGADGRGEWLFCLLTARTVVPPQPTPASRVDADVEVVYESVEIPRRALLKLAHTNGFTDADALGSGGVLPARLAGLVRSSHDARLVSWVAARGVSGADAVAEDVDKTYFPTRWEGAVDTKLPNGKTCHKPAKPELGEPSSLGQVMHFTATVLSGHSVWLKLKADDTEFDGWRNPDGTILREAVTPRKDACWMGELASFSFETQIELPAGETLQVARVQGKKRADSASRSFFGAEDILEPGAKLGEARDQFIFATARIPKGGERPADSAKPAASATASEESDNGDQFIVEAKVVRASDAVLKRLGVDPASGDADWGKVACSPAVETLAGGNLISQNGDEAMLEGASLAYFLPEEEPARKETPDPGNATNQQDPTKPPMEITPNEEGMRFLEPTMLGYCLYATPQAGSDAHYVNVKLRAEWNGFAGSLSATKAHTKPSIKSRTCNPSVTLPDGATACVWRRQTETSGGGREWLLHLVTVKRVGFDGQPAVAGEKPAEHERIKATVCMVEIPRQELLKLAYANGFTDADALGNGGILPVKLAGLVRGSPKAKLLMDLGEECLSETEGVAEHVVRQYFPMRWDGGRKLMQPDGTIVNEPVAPEFGEWTNIGSMLHFTPRVWKAGGRRIQMKLTPELVLFAGWRAINDCGRVIYAEHPPPGETWMAELARIRFDGIYNQADGATVQVARLQGKKRADSASQGFFGPDDILKPGAKLGEERDLFIFVTARRVQASPGAATSESP